MPSDKDPEAALRNARAQAAIVRTLASEALREGRGNEQAEGLHAQTVEASARLVAAVEGLSKARSVAPPSGPDAAHPFTGASRRRILVVDDDAEVRSAIVKGLSANYDVVSAGNGAEAVEIAAVLPLDAIVSDIWMPEMDGVTMVERIRTMHAPTALPVVFLTGETAPEKVAAGFSAGGTVYLVKPVDLELLELELRLIFEQESPRP